MVAVFLGGRRIGRKSGVGLAAASVARMRDVTQPETDCEFDPASEMPIGFWASPSKGHP